MPKPHINTSQIIGTVSLLARKYFPATATPQEGSQYSKHPKQHASYILRQEGQDKPLGLYIFHHVYFCLVLRAFQTLTFHIVGLQVRGKGGHVRPPRKDCTNVSVLQYVTLP